MRIAALFDVHANLPALEAVLAELRAERVDHVVVGGDVVPGPMPRETIARLLGLDVPTTFIYGNGERAVLAQIGVEPDQVTYWGTTSGRPLPPEHQEVLRWNAAEVHPEYDEVLRGWPATCRFTVPGIGDVLFCHATPRSETECFTRLTPEALLRPVFDDVDAALVVCGHTHMQFDRTIGRVRVVNAGSVGMPFGDAGADWAILGPDVELRHTAYDLEGAAARVRASRYPQAETFAAHSILQPPSAASMLEAFTSVSFR